MPNGYKTAIALKHQSHFEHVDLGRIIAVIFHEHSGAKGKSIKMSRTDPISIGTRHAYGIY